MNDSDLLVTAIDAAGVTPRRFAADVLDVDQRNLRRWLTGAREMQSTVRVVCAAVVKRPELAAELSRAHETLKEWLEGVRKVAAFARESGAVDDPAAAGRRWAAMAQQTAIADINARLERGQETFDASDVRLLLLALGYDEEKSVP